MCICVRAQQTHSQEEQDSSQRSTEQSSGAGAGVGGGVGGVAGAKEPEDDLSGIGIKVSFTPGGGEMKEMQQLSGGQKCVVALAIIFAIQKCDPAPFYLFDEIDAALDVQHRHAVASILSSLLSPQASFPFPFPFPLLFVARFLRTDFNTYFLCQSFLPCFLFHYSSEISYF